MTDQDIIDAAEYADIRWSDADVPLGWLRHFVDALGKQQEERNFCPRCGKRAGKNDWDVHTCSLPEPEQEPVAWMVIGDGEYGEYLPGAHFDTLGAGNADYWKVRGYELQPLYTTPPQREWVGLTEQEAADCWSTSAVQTWREIEAALKEKNT